MNKEEHARELFITAIDSDNGSEFTATALKEWLNILNVFTVYIEPVSPWENGFCESFNSKMRDEFLNGEIFDTLIEAEILTNQWSYAYNTIRPHSSLVCLIRLPRYFQKLNTSVVLFTSIGMYSRLPNAVK